MNHPDPSRITVRRSSKPDGVSAEVDRCQVCGVPVGRGITHCLRCRTMRSVVSGEQPAAPRRTSLWPLLAALLAAGVAAAWVVSRRAAVTPDEPGDTGEVVAGPAAESTHAGPSRPPAAAASVATASAAAPAPAVPARPPAVARPATPRPSTRPVRLSATCRACGGSGKIRSGSSVRTCPICRGTPVKTRWVSPDRRLCPRCAGFGRVMAMRHGSRRPATCPDCRGCGLCEK